MIDFRLLSSVIIKYLRQGIPLQSIDNVIRYLYTNEKKIIGGMLSMKLEENELKRLKEDLNNINQDICILESQGYGDDELVIQLVNQRNELSEILRNNVGD